MSSALSAAFQLFCSAKGVPLGSPVADRIRLSVFDGFDGFNTLDSFQVYSVGPKTKGKEMGDDEAFLTTPGLLQVVPRGGAILVKDGTTIVKFLGGPAKFFGIQVHDDDDIGDATAGAAAGAAGAASVEALVQAVTSKTDSDIQTIFQWAHQGVLHATKTNKENGKFGNVTLYQDRDSDVIYILFGSKGCHMVTTFDRIDATLAALRHSNSTLMAGVLGDIQRIYPALLRLKGEFEAGWSAAAEFCDEAHLCPASDDTRNRLVFFGLFDTHGATMRTKVSDELFRAAGLLTVQKEVVFTPDMPVEQLYAVLHASDLAPLVEGSVLYFENTTSGHTVILKKKSAWYIFLRGLREIIKRGYTYKLETRVKNWLVEKCGSGYLKFSTAAAQRAVRVAYAFTDWMRDNNIPVGALGHMPVKGLAVHGFIPFWLQYLATAGSLDLLLEAGPFSSADFLAPNPELRQYNLADHRDSNQVTVLFWQGVPGLGKSTLAKHIVAKMEMEIKMKDLSVSIIEQDRCGGCSATTLIALSHVILQPGGKRKRLIIVSRNNGNPSQYHHYLTVCHELNVRTFFLAPDKMGPLVLAVSLAGCLERTCPTDPTLLMMGNTPMAPLALVEGVTDVHYKKFTFHPQALRYAPLMASPPPPALSPLYKEAGAALGKGKEALLAFVVQHCDTLRQMRTDAETIFTTTLQGHLDLLLLQPEKARPYMVLPEPREVCYVGGMVASGDRDRLHKILLAHLGGPGGVGASEIVNHHVTLHFHGRKDKVPLPANLPLPGDNLPFSCHISGLVIFHFHDAALGKAAAWVLKRTAPEDPLYHITALVPPHKKAQFSNNFIHLLHGTTTSEGRVQVILMNGEIPPFPLVCQWMTQ
jgi:hypothetical protein